MWPPRSFGGRHGLGGCWRQYAHGYQGNQGCWFQIWSQINSKVIWSDIFTGLIEVIQHHMPISHSPCRRRYIGPLPSCSHVCRRRRRGNVRIGFQVSGYAFSDLVWTLRTRPNGVGHNLYFMLMRKRRRLRRKERTQLPLVFHLLPSSQWYANSPITFDRPSLSRPRTQYFSVFLPSFDVGAIDSNAQLFTTFP